MATTQDDKILTNGDYDIYAEIMHSTGETMRKMKLNEKPTEAGNGSTY